MSSYYPDGLEDIADDSLEYDEYEYNKILDQNIDSYIASMEEE